MAEVELPIHELNVQELLATAAGISTALEDNAHFPDPQPTPQELDEFTTRVKAADEAYRQQRELAVAAKRALDAAEDDLRAALGKVVKYVQEKSGGEIGKILSANLHVEEETTFWPFNRMGTVGEVVASLGDRPGEIDLAWDPVPNASGYEVEIAYDLNGEGPWEQSGATHRSSITVEQLNNRTRYWFRVRAVGEKGAGDWSEPVTKFAP